MAGKNLKVALQVQADLNQAKREIGSLKDEIKATSKVADAATASQSKTSKAVGITADEVKKLSGATNLKDGVRQLSDYENWLSKTSTASKNVAGSNKLIENSITSLTPHLMSLIGLSGGFIAIAVDTLNKAVELQNLANLGGTNVEQFQYYAAGAKKVGIEQDKLGDIFKDTRDKVGDFLATGGGEMADFFETIGPKVGVTAEQFKKLSGPEALQLYYDSLQKAGVSQNEMVFYMESIADEGSALIPLLADGGAGWKKYGDAAKEAGAILSQDTVDNAKKAKSAMGDFQNSVTGVTNTLVANAAPAIVFVAENLDVLVRAGLIVASVFAGRMITATAATTIAFIAGRIEAIKYQMALASMAGIATNTAARLTALSTVARLLTAVGGLPGLAIAAAGVAASFFLMPSSAEAATDSLDDQGKSVAELAEEYKKLNAESKQITLSKLTDQLIEQESAVKDAGTAMETYLEQKMQSIVGVSGEARKALEQYFNEIKAGGDTAKTAFDRLRDTKLLNENELAKVASLGQAFVNTSDTAAVTQQKIDILSGKTTTFSNTSDSAAKASKSLSGNLDTVGTSADGAATKVNGLAKAYTDYMQKLQSSSLSNSMTAGLMISGISEKEARMETELYNAKNSDPKANQTYFVTDADREAYKMNIASEQAITDLAEKRKKQEEAQTKEKEKQTKLALTQKAISAASNEQTRNMLMVYQALSKAGLPDNTARYFTAEIGREGSYQNKNLFGSHKDANNGYANTGMISWQKDRSKDLMAFLRGQGVLDDKGQIKQTQEALDAQAEFLVNELFTNKAYSKSKNALLSGKGYKDLQQTVGNNYIGWDIAANTLSSSAVNKNIGRMDGYKNQLDSLLGTDPTAVLSDFSKISKIREDFLKAEEQQDKNRISLRESYYSDDEKTLSEHNKRISDLNKAGYSDTELKVLLEKENQRYEDVLSKRPEILKRVQDSLTSLNESFLRSSGNDLDADLAAVDEKWKQPKADLASLMMTESDPLQANEYQQMLVKIDFVIDKEKLTLQFNDAMQQLEELQSLRSQRQDNLKVQYDSGQISRPQYADGLEAINADMLPTMQALAEQAKVLAENLGDAFSVAKIENFTASLTEVDTESRKFLPTLGEIEERIASGMTDAIMAWADGTKTASQAFREFASSFLREIAQMILKQMIFNAIKAISGYADGGLVTGFSSGGYTGAGGKYQEAGIVHKDEFVIRKESTSQSGAKEFLGYFNRYGMDALNKFKGYADGGLVGAPNISMPTIQAPKLNNPTEQIAQSTSFNANQNFYLVDDPARILDVLKSGASQENLVVMMSRDPSKFKAALKIG